MGSNNLHKNTHLKASTKKKRGAALAAACAAAAIAQQKYSVHFDKLPKNTSRLSGQDWLKELLEGHPKHFYSAMGMNKHVFLALLEALIKVGLHDTRWVPAGEQLAIFLHLAVTGLPQRQLEERFQRSPDTLSKSVFIHC